MNLLALFADAHNALHICIYIMTYNIQTIGKKRDLVKIYFLCKLYICYNPLSFYYFWTPIVLMSELELIEDYSAITSLYSPGKLIPLLP